LPDAGYPVLTASSVGVVSWVLPKVNIIDALGLNDYVVARNPDLNLPIEMAHERRPPKGYTECFADNVVLDKGHFTVIPRATEMTAEKIVRCEQEFAAAVLNYKITNQPLPAVQNPIDDPHFLCISNILTCWIANRIRTASRIGPIISWRAPRGVTALTIAESVSQSFFLIRASSARPRNCLSSLRCVIRRRAPFC